MNLIDKSLNINDRRLLVDWDVNLHCKSIKLLKLAPGSTVGNHYHLEKDELFILVSGRIDKIRLSDRTFSDLTAPAAWLVNRGEYHSYHCDEEVVLMCLSTEGYSSHDDYRE